MWKSKDIYYISDGTGILATNVGYSLICQFPEINFFEEKFPFISTVSEAQKTLEYILQQSGGRRPIIFSTLMNEDIRAIFNNPEIELFDLFDFFLDRLEHCLEARALRVPGFSRQIDSRSMAKRVEAINYCLEHDDGVKPRDYAEADVIVLGVSRVGKTPLSVYLATQMGLKTANFPLTEEYLDSYRLPEEITGNSRKVVGLTTSPQFLHDFRSKRYAGSRYAMLSTCTQEIQQASEIYYKYKIPVINSAGKSIEEIATQISVALAINKKSGGTAHS